jgi:hypothetical protein
LESSSDCGGGVFGGSAMASGSGSSSDSCGEFEAAGCELGEVSVAEVDGVLDADRIGLAAGEVEGVEQAAAEVGTRGVKAAADAVLANSTDDAAVEKVG